MITKQVVIPQETVDYIQRLSFEVEGMKSIVKEIITDAQTSPLLLEGEGFKSYNKKYEERFAKYDLAKNDLQKKFIPEEDQGRKLNRWDLDFSTCVLTYEVME